MITRAQAYARIERALREFGVGMSALEARYLLCEAAEISQSSLLTSGEEPLRAQAEARLDAMVKRRLTGEPLARVLGHAEFWGLSLRVNASVLDPRGDSETLIRAALELLEERKAGPLRILDLGTGSGALLCAILSECPNAFGVGVDVSFAAAHSALVNLHRCGLAARAAIMVSDWAAAIRGKFDLILSNPPYIVRADIATLDVSVRDFDPHLALDGGMDGFEAYRLLCAQLPQLLGPGGLAVFEAGAGQAAGISALFAQAGLHSLRNFRDYGGIERAVTGKYRFLTNFLVRPFTQG